MAYSWPWYESWEPSDRRLGPALLRLWTDPGAALAYARKGLESALAGKCPFQAREWREALEFVEREAPRMKGHRKMTLREFVEAMGVER